MKWGRRKKNSLPSSPRPSLLSSWILKFKKMGGSNNQNDKYVKGNTKRNTNPPAPAASRMMSYSHGNSNGLKGGVLLNGGRSDRYDGYDGGDDVSAFWRLSFKEEGSSIDGVPGRGVLRPVWYDSDEEEPDAPPSSCKSCSLRVEEGERVQNFDEMVSEIRGRRQEVLPDCVGGYGSNEQILLKMEKDLSKLELETGAEIEGKGISAMDSNPRKYVHVLDKDSSLNASKLREDPSFSPLDLRKTRGGNLKIHEKQRKSLHVRREIPKRKLNQSNDRVKVYSPRTASRVETRKLQAPEDMRKAKSKMKKKKKKKMMMMMKQKRIAEERNGLEKFAVVKCSFDPARDFRESMMEMIVERRIGRPDELEELLACYLTLNSDVYHDLIIKVFRQVWFELNQTWFENNSAESHGEKLLLLSSRND